MRKLSLLTLLIALATLFTSCEISDDQLAQRLKGAWAGESIVNGKKAKMEYQYFESTDGKTGKFVEITHLNVSDTVNGTEYVMPYKAYVGGDYSINNGLFSITYLPETIQIVFDKDAINSYAQAFIANENGKENSEFANTTPEELAASIIKSGTKELSSDMKSFYVDYNELKPDGYENLRISENKMSFMTSDVAKVEFNRMGNDILEEYPY